MNIIFRLKPLVVIILLFQVLLIQGCLLAYITEPDEQAKFSEANGGIVEFKNGYCENGYSGVNPKDSDLKNYYKSSKIDLDKKISTIIRNLSSKSDVIRTNSVTELGELGLEKLGDQADLSINKVEYLAINDPSKWVRRASVKSLAKLGSPSSLKVIMSSTNDPDPYVRHSAVNAKKIFNKTQKARLK